MYISPLVYRPASSCIALNRPPASLAFGCITLLPMQLLLASKKLRLLALQINTSISILTHLGSGTVPGSGQFHLLA